MDEEGLFAAYAHGRGGHVDPMKVGGSARLGSDMLLTLSNHGPLTRIARRNAAGEPLVTTFGVMDELSPNGAAERVGDRHFCSMTYGHYLACLGLSVHMFRHTDLFPGIGRPPAQANFEAIPMAPGFAFLNTLRSAAARLVEPWPTDDPARMEGALFFRNAMVSLVLMHEYFHAAEGHCDMAKAVGFRGALREFGPRPPSVGDAHLYLWFEYLADRLAIRQLFGLIETDNDMLTVLGVTTLSRYDRFRLGMVAAGVLTAMWHAYGQRAEMPDFVHPAPKHRLLAFLYAARDRMLEVGTSPAETNQILDEAAMDLALIGRRSPDLRSALQDAMALRASGPFMEHEGLMHLIDELEQNDRLYAYEVI